MFEQLIFIVPRGVARVILDFEGRIYEAQLRDFVTNIYVRDYKRSLGSTLLLSHVVNAQPLAKLEWFAHFAAILGNANDACRKSRKSRVHSLSFAQDCKLFDYRCPKTTFSPRNIRNLLCGSPFTD